MTDRGQELLDYACMRFENGEYDAALEAFILSYTNNYEQECVLENIYNCYMKGNDAEFRKNYDRWNTGGEISYEECTLDFIPYREGEYYIFDKEIQKFRGIFSMDRVINIVRHENFRQMEFGALAAVIDWDFSRLPEILAEAGYRKVYVVCRDKNRCVSFFKIPELAEYAENIMIFFGGEEFQQYFHENMAEYLPKQCAGAGDETQNLLAVINQEHEYRLTAEGRNTDRVMLTIGIPSYNRGHRALKNICNLQKLPYDSEIEFLVVDNCSTENTDGYDEIKKMQAGDSRISYYRFPDNPGGNSSGFEVLERAKGKFCCLLSDEDRIVLENVESYLQIIQMYGDTVGFIRSAGGQYYVEGNKFEKVPRGDAAFGELFWGLNYISGLIFNTRMWHGKNMCAKLKQQGKENLFVAAYAYNAAALYICLDKDVYISRVQLFEEGEAEERSAGDVITDGKQTLGYASPDQRIAQMEGLLQILNECADSLSVETVKQMYADCCGKVFFLLDLYRKIYGDTVCDFQKAYKQVLEASIADMDKLAVELTKEEYEGMVGYFSDTYMHYMSVKEL